FSVAWIVLKPGTPKGSPGLDPFLLVGVTAERARVRELAELVPDHVLRHEHLVEHPTVVHLERVPDELGNDRARTRPRLDGLLVAALLELLHLPVELLVDIRTLLQTA